MRQFDAEFIARVFAVIALAEKHTFQVLTPRLSARLEGWGSEQPGLALAVWLETPEPLARIEVVIQEARNFDSPVGFNRGQRGVINELPPALEAEGLRPAWQTDTLHPIATGPERMPPGTAAVWLMELRSRVQMSAGVGCVRFKALATAERDKQVWEIPLPVTITDKAADQMITAAGEPDR
jgi:hypothetical protein